MLLFTFSYSQDKIGLFFLVVARGCVVNGLILWLRKWLQNAQTG